MPALIIRIKKKTDGSAALSCTRADGSVTWQRQDGAQGAFFPFHDLTHYAAETVLGNARGFWGLVAEGWDLSDFGKPWPRGPLPVAALASEFLVGFLDQERAARVQWSAADCTGGADTYFSQHGVPGELTVTDDQLGRIRDFRRELFARWARVPAGAAVVLEFAQEAPTTG